MEGIEGERSRMKWGLLIIERNGGEGKNLLDKGYWTATKLSPIFQEFHIVMVPSSGES